MLLRHTIQKITRTTITATCRTASACAVSRSKTSMSEGGLNSSSGRPNRYGSVRRSAELSGLARFGGSAELAGSASQVENQLLRRKVSIFSSNKFG